MSSGAPLSQGGSRDGYEAEGKDGEVEDGIPAGIPGAWHGHGGERQGRGPSAVLVGTSDLHNVVAAGEEVEAEGVVAGGCLAP